MENLNLKPVDEKLLPELTEIYNYYILNTTATFHKNILDINAMREILFSGDPRFPSFALFDGEELCGYCILARYKKREAYDGTAEVTIYLKRGFERRGIGTYAVKRLEEIAVANRFHTLLSVICGENEGSIRLFTGLGYEKCAHYREVGAKFGRMLDIVSYQKILSD